MENKLENLSLEELNSLYTIVNEVCSELSKMTDNYSLTTGDNKFEHIPLEFRKMIETRQKFISYKLRLKDMLISKVSDIMEKYEQD